MSKTVASRPLPTVLVIEDEALVAMLVTDTLEDAGYRPFWSADGRGAPVAPGSGPAPEAAVVGLRMLDGGDGRQVIRRLRERRPAMPVVVVTGFHPETPEADLRGLGGPTLRLRKPFDCDDLTESVAAVLDAPAVPAGRRRRAADSLVVPV